MEPQEEIDYSLALRNMLYDVAEYEKQAVKIRKKVRKEYQGLSTGEYLYGFKRDSKLLPVLTFILYSGEDEWAGPTCLHDMLEFTDIPENIRKMIPNYKINIISIRDIEDTSIFKTDLRYVLEFLHHANNKEKLKELVNSDSYYQSMDEEAYDVVANYANVKKLLEVKDEYKNVEGRVNMCTAIKEMMEDSKLEGRTEGRKEVIVRQVRTKLERGDSVEKIADDLVEEIGVIREIIKELQ